MPDLTKFKQYYAGSSQIVDLASREEMAEVMRLLALHVTHLERLYGPAPRRIKSSEFDQRIQSG